MIKLMNLTLTCVFVCAAGCAGDDAKALGPTGATEERDSGLSTDQDPATVYEQPAPWSELTIEQRFEFMQKVVVPEMTAVFQKADPEAKVSCGTCHGENARAVGFKMPNGLAPLNIADFPLNQSPDKDIAAAAAFMAAEVVPAMAALLEIDVRSPENPMGFGCFSCHARAE
jgi:hypothetical protein